MSQQNVQPIAKGHARVPVIIQLEEPECGVASLAMVLAYYKKWVPLEQVRVDYGVSRDGSNAVNILKAARHYGLEAKDFSGGRRQRLMISRAIVSKPKVQIFDESDKRT